MAATRVDAGTISRRGSETGTSTATYAALATIDMRNMGVATIMLKNTGASKTLKYKILGYASYNGTLSDELKAETTVAASTQATTLKVSDGYEKIVVQIKNGDGATTALCEYMKRGI